MAQGNTKQPLSQASRRIATVKSPNPWTDKYPASKYPYGSACPLRLDYNRTTPKKGEKPKQCPNPIGYHRGVGKYSEPGKEQVWKAVRGPIPCNSWRCEVCGPRKKKQLKARLYRGQISQQEGRKGFRPSPYSAKILTLTAPGAEWRARHTPEEAYRIMSANLSKLMDAMRKEYGNEFHYFKVVEPQGDGFPHFHILLKGEAIAPKGILDFIRRLWCKKYQMGNCDIQVMKHGLKGGVNYILKYMTKEMAPIMRGARIFSASHGALQRKERRWEWYASDIKIGFGWVQADSMGNAISNEIDIDITGLDKSWPQWEHFTEELRCRIREDAFWLAIQESLEQMGLWY